VEPVFGVAPSPLLRPRAGKRIIGPMRTAILMPAFNEHERIGRTLEAIRDCAPALGGICVVVVDDGSEPELDPTHFPSKSEHFRMVLARHVVNLGQGAALETARRLALGQPSLDVFVTMDADGQHRVDGLRALVFAVRQGADIALGSRFLGRSSEMPPLRRCLIQGARLLEAALTGSRLTDAHTGFRAFSRRALAQVALRQNRMAHATEITLHVHRLKRIGFNVIEVPVCVEYSEQTLRKGQRATGAIRILRDLMHRFLFEEN
jgi:polyprenyl-phospho-N-acetylgalactosaminyl synthase